MNCVGRGAICHVNCGQYLEREVIVGVMVNVGLALLIHVEPPE